MPDLIVQRDFRLYGGVGDIYERVFAGTMPRETLCFGPSRTGKSLGLCLIFTMLCEEFPGIRVLMLRKALTSMRETILVTLEGDALPGGHPALRASNRHSQQPRYEFDNGSVIVAGGCNSPDDIQKIMSSEWDAIFCFPGDTTVECDSPVVRATRREYSGEVVTIETARGHKLTGTPNHPVLTGDGWVPLGLLQCGDDVFSRGRVKPESLGVNPDVQHKPASISDVFGAMSFSGSCRSQRVVGRGVDFHGDGAAGDVDVVSAAGGFHVGFNADGFQHGVEGRRVRRDFELLSVMGLGEFGSMQFGMDASSIGLMREFCKRSESGLPLRRSSPADCGLSRGIGEVRFPLGSSVSDMSNTGGVRLSSGAVAASAKFGFQRGVADSDGLGDLDQPSISCEVSLDRVVHIRRGDVGSGSCWHVYNLETKNHYYLAGGIVAHNCNEATDIALSDWEKCLTRLSHGKLPLGNFAIADCNPQGPAHWINKRSLPVSAGGEGRMWRVEQWLDQNPKFVDQETGQYTPEGVKYLGVLDGLTGVRLQRLRYGKWVAAEGVIWEDWNPDVHVIDRPPPPGVIVGCIGSIDWGFAAPGCALVGGVDAENRVYILAQVYRAEMSDDWWLEVCNELTDEYGVKAWAADPEDAGAVSKFRRAGLPMHEARKRVAAGLDAVRDRLRVAHDGLPRLMVVRDNLRRGACPVCVEKKWPTRLEEEIPEYVYAEYEEGKPIKEVPAPGQADHAADGLRYLCCHVDAIDFRSAPQRQPLPPNSIGKEDEYEEIMRRSRLGLPHDGRGKWRDRKRRSCSS